MAPMHLVGEVSKITSMTFRLFGNILGGGIIIHMLFDFLSSRSSYLTPLIFGTIALHLLLRNLLDKNIAWLTSAYKITTNVLNLLFLITCSLQVIFGIGDGLLQAFVLTILTITYLALAMQHDEAPVAHLEEQP